MAHLAHLDGLIDLLVEAVVRDIEMENAALPGRNNAAFEDSTSEEYISPRPPQA